MAAYAQIVTDRRSPRAGAEFVFHGDWSLRSARRRQNATLALSSPPAFNSTARRIRHVYAPLKRRVRAHAVETVEAAASEVGAVRTERKLDVHVT